ncbi:MAG: hypothetical protein JJ908_01890 [Rhizobiales bacterium]|nr:hypothetical protein [Hyphomicrobiales bacterium]MBO6698645.1 hypothetical protein [Hyphomicrobiales bacterium]MBO6735102.1 hypothetical protein [Hyphomicrobiales bacterium]MBO6911091.1 hypothetical protein [Hyphomicrobiales bacterium]MBO6957012.1 hypothetical protein [Hyphomicrobiales bacterium]
MLVYSSLPDIQKKLSEGRALRSQAWIGLFRALAKTFKRLHAKRHQPADRPPPSALPA